MTASADLPSGVLDFVHDTTVDDLPSTVVDQAIRLLLDLVGVAASGRATELSAIIHDHAVDHFGPGRLRAPLLFDGRMVSPAGAALANGMTIDSIDAHDGHNLTKGHTGCHQLPALLALMAAEGIDDPNQFLATLVVGYEFATRVGIALHRMACDYHTSGAWGAVGCAAIGARLLDLDRTATFEAMGIAEYHGPRSQMMRVIDHPTMLKDGSGWGAMAGVSAAYLAKAGFTGAPAVTVNDRAVADIWADLGSQWIIADQYLKPHPVCRWAQPAVEASLSLRRRHGIDPADIERVEIETFHEAARLAVALPVTTEQAQYSLPFPVAAALVRGRLGATEVTADALADPSIRSLSQRVAVVEDEAHNEAFPANRYARVTVLMADGTRHESDDTEPRGDATPELALGEDELRAKYHLFADPVLGTKRSSAIAIEIGRLSAGRSLSALSDLLAPPL